MMRSLYSGVSGLKVHQTKMDVIGNNIANVNTVGFKGSTVTFADVFYQTTQSATGANEETGAAGRNAMQIGLGASLASITANIATAGGSQRTDNPFDCMINGDGFFIVNGGNGNYFTKNGSFGVDAAGNLCTAGGANVMGWQVDKDGNVVQAAVSALRIMAPENLYAKPEPTTQAYISGNIDKNDTQLSSATGYPAQLSFYDNVGNSYTAKLSVKNKVPALEGEYSITLTDIVDSNDKSIFSRYDATATPPAYVLATTPTVTLSGVTYTASAVNAETGEVTSWGATGSATIKFDPSNGEFVYVYGSTTPTAPNAPKTITLDVSKLGVASPAKNAFPTQGVTIDFSKITRYSASSKCNLESTKGSAGTDGSKAGLGAGLPVGQMTGVSIDASGKIYGTYDNGTNKLLGQVAVATFANPAGLEAIGGDLFAQTKNSGEFDGVGQDPSSNGGSLTTGVLEMSNVDLSTEFTNMITTQRGFQANSRIITTSDTMLEELINLKR